MNEKINFCVTISRFNVFRFRMCLAMFGTLLFTGSGLYQNGTLGQASSTQLRNPSNRRPQNAQEALAANTAVADKKEQSMSMGYLYSSSGVLMTSIEFRGGLKSSPVVFTEGNQITLKYQNLLFDHLSSITITR